MQHKLELNLLTLIRSNCAAPVREDWGEGKYFYSKLSAINKIGSITVAMAINIIASTAAMP